MLHLGLRGIDRCDQDSALHRSWQHRRASRGLQRDHGRRQALPEMCRFFHSQPVDPVEAGEYETVTNQAMLDITRGQAGINSCEGGSVRGE